MFPRWQSGKESTRKCRRHKRFRFNPWVGKIPWKRKWQHTPVFLAGRPHGQRSLEGYSPWACKESDMTGWPHTHTHTHIHNLYINICMYVYVYMCVCVCVYIYIYKTIFLKLGAWNQADKENDSLVIKVVTSTWPWQCPYSSIQPMEFSRPENWSG